MEKSGVKYECEIPRNAVVGLSRNMKIELTMPLDDFKEFLDKQRAQARQEGYNERKRLELAARYSTPLLLGSNRAYHFYNGARRSRKTTALFDAMLDYMAFGTGVFECEYKPRKEDRVTPKEVISKLNGKRYPVVGEFGSDHYVIKSSNGRLHIGTKDSFRLPDPVWQDVTGKVYITRNICPDMGDGRGMTDTLCGLGYILGWLNPARVIEKVHKLRFVIRDVYLASEIERSPWTYAPKRKAIFIEEAK